MSADGVTFGLAISKARMAIGLSQKEFAARVMKEEGGGAISPQHLDEIEHDRRSPSSGHLIRQFSGILIIPEDYLYAFAGRLPDDLRPDASPPDKVVEAFANFRKTLKEQEGSHGEGLRATTPNIQTKKNRLRKLSWNPELHENRNATLRMCGCLKDFRRTATRYDRRAGVILSAVALAATVSYWL